MGLGPSRDIVPGTSTIPYFLLSRELRDQELQLDNIFWLSEVEMVFGQIVNLQKFFGMEGRDVKVHIR
jgi:hypothetical protein